MTRIAIIGAGISDLSAAHSLKDHADIIISENEHGVSGHMSTRYAEPYFFDHGAQYFTARTKPFQDFIQPLLNQGIIDRWDARCMEFKGNKIIKRQGWRDEEPRYVGIVGMDQVVKFLAKDFDVHTNTKIISLNDQGTWKLTDEQNERYSGFDWVICTLPSPQSVEILPKSFKYYDNIKAIEIKACLSLMLGFEHSFPTKFDAAYKAIHEWQCASNAKRNQIRPVFLDRDHRLAVCGDWCLGGRVEGAFTSAHDLYLSMKDGIEYSY